MRKINYPLIVSDFDGTLVRSDGSISARNKAAINAYIDAGGVFVISTGRMPSGILPRAQELGLQGIISCCQGAIIVDIQTKKLLLEGRLSLESTLAACEALEEMDLHIHAFDLWDYYANKDDDALKLYEAAVKSKAKLVTEKKLSQFIREKALSSYKLLAMVEPKDSDRVLNELSAKKIKGCALTKSAEFLVEVVNPNYSKGTAVTFLAEHYGVPLEKTIAIGDQRNDLSMIEAAGLGIAVKNADKYLKEKATCVLEYTNNEDAVAHVIEKYGFYEEK